ncbi:MAG: TerB family tellurite resistance protein [Deltaproteobacteria bacterium]|nr:TerB family tellurite resistance protein [Deltaproteobacteria bacterium]
MSDFTKHELTLAMGHHIAQHVIAADRLLEDVELAALHTIFPRDGMVAAGFLNTSTGKYTGDFEEAARVALRQLPPLLDDDEKVEMMRVWWAIANADGELAAAESEVLMKAGQALGWSLDRIQEVFEQLAMEDAH